MMKTLYWLPEEERGCNAIELRRVDWGAHGWAIEFQPGVAVADEAQQPDPATFVPDPDFKLQGRTVKDPADFVAWLDEQTQTAPTVEQHFAGGLMAYLWLQHKGIRPLPFVEPEPEA